MKIKLNYSYTAQIMRHQVCEIELDEEEFRQLVDDEMTDNLGLEATDIADYLQGKGEAATMIKLAKAEKAVDDLLESVARAAHSSGNYSTEIVEEADQDYEEDEFEFISASVVLD